MYNRHWFFTLGIFSILGLFLHFSTSNLMPQPPFESYEKDWAKVDSLTNIGQYASAREIVQGIYDHAVATEEYPEVAKSVIYLSGFISWLEEGGSEQVLQYLEGEIDKASGHLQLVLQSVTASYYQNYLNAKYWQIQERTEMVGDPGEDPATWSAGQLEAKIASLYLASVSDPKALQFPSTDYDQIVTTLNAEEDYRPTMYDLLAHRALDYFSTTTSYLNQPAYRFYLDAPEAFGDVRTFVNTEFATQDTASFSHRALLLFQEVLAFHQDEPQLLLDADIRRMRFVYEKSVHPEKADLYLAALEQMTTAYAGQPGVAEILFLKAQLFFSQGAAYQIGMEDEALRMKWRDAWKLCKEIQDRYPNTYGASHAAGLIAQLENQQIQVQTESVLVPEEDVLLQVRFRNIPRAHFRIIPLNDDIVEKLEDNRRQDYEKRWRYLRGLEYMRAWTTTLPQPNDFREHITELGLNGLPTGRFILLVSTDSDFRKEGFGGYCAFQVSNLATSRRTSVAAGSEVLVVDRTTGAPRPEAEVEVFHGSWNSVARKMVWEKEFTGNTDEMGFLTYPTQDNGNYKLVVREGDDVLHTNSFYSGRFYQQNRSSTQYTNFFLDRSIYRPGQTIYFKGLLTERSPDNKPRILPNQKVTVTFKDANYQVVEQLTLTSNEFGTVQGNFVAPEDRLPGQMHLTASVGGNSTYFRVEEYKRPKFEVTFDPVEGAYKLDETVLVSGEAKAFAGNVLDEVLVKYRVVREVQFPRWAWYWRRYYGGSSMEIAQGTTQTDAAGKFEISFVAQPDRTVSADQRPYFRYTVYADVIDGTGETHSANTAVRVGYVGLEASLPIGEILRLDSFRMIPVSVRNLNGQEVAAQGQLLLELLEPPLDVMRERYWMEPDLPIMTEKVFHARFPELPYGEEGNPLSWQVDRMVWSKNFDTGANKMVPLDRVRLVPGTYRLTLTTQDADGQEVKDVRTFQLFDPKGKTAPTQALGWTYFDQTGQLEPWMEAEIFLGSPQGTEYYLVEANRAGKLIKRQWVSVKGLHTFNRLIQEEDRGALNWNILTFHHNRSSYQTINPAIPWSNKELDISFRTFRDKMLPGSEERWEMVIRGPKGAEAAAEMVAAMYDASLDQIVPHSWTGVSWPTYFQAQYRWNIDDFGAVGVSWLNSIRQPYPSTAYKSYRALEPFSPLGYSMYGGRYYDAVEIAADGVMAEDRGAKRLSAAPEMEEAPAQSAPPPPPPAPGEGTTEKSADLDQANEDELAPTTDGPQIPVRTNLNETVFFMPDLRTDAEGNVILSFTMNEALTKWKFLSFAHTKDLKVGQYMTYVQTQKPLMVQPNPPRFYREGDEIEFTSKVVNLSEETLTGNVHLEMVDPLSSEPVFKWQDNPDFNRNFTLEPGRSTSVSWRFKVPDVMKFPLLEHTVVAAAGDFADAERAVVPVLSNRELVTESLPLAVRGNQTKDFTLQHLANYESATLSHTGFTLEFTSNPAWYAVQSLPYLMEYPHECSEQIFSRYYANSLAASVANSQPRIKDIFESWKGTDAMESPLALNQELKSAILAETPWVLQAQSEAQQRQNIGLLFDLQRMAKEQAAALAKLQQRQLPGGGFAWFPGGRDSWYITQYIVEGMGHLDKLGVKDLREDPAAWAMVKSAVAYIDARLLEHFEELEARVRRGETKMEDDHLDYLVLHYLYARSFFLQDRSARASQEDMVPTPDVEYLPLEGRLETAFDYYLGQAEEYWVTRSQYAKGLIALSLHRMGKGEVPALIVKALDEQAIRNDELGAYWNYQGGYYWYQHTTETHSLMIEVFDEVANDAEMVELLKIWLLKNRQTNHWSTTKSTASAVYALLMNGDNWLAETGQVQITLGTTANPLWQQQIEAAQADAQAGTGYFKTRFDADMVTRDMANIQVVNPNKVIAWGAVYWQYMEDLDKIERYEETPLQIVKEVYRVDLSDRGEQLVPLENGATLQPGDKLKVRIELRVDRSMEYVHLKDMRASGFEPIETLSSYKWQDGLGYYESPRDLATDFFISYLPKGTFVFEYPLRVVHRGDFSNGITTVQCMYAPEFTSHSEGIRIRVE